MQHSRVTTDASLSVAYGADTVSIAHARVIDNICKLVRISELGSRYGVCWGKNSYLVIVYGFVFFVTHCSYFDGSFGV